MNSLKGRKIGIVSQNENIKRGRNSVNLLCKSLPRHIGLGYIASGYLAAVYAFTQIAFDNFFYSQNGKQKFAPSTNAHPPTPFNSSTSEISTPFAHAKSTALNVNISFEIAHRRSMEMPSISSTRHFSLNGCFSKLLLAFAIKNHSVSEQVVPEAHLRRLSYRL